MNWAGAAVGAALVIVGLLTLPAGLLVLVPLALLWRRS